MFLVIAAAAAAAAIVKSQFNITQEFLFQQERISDPSSQEMWGI